MHRIPGSHLSPPRPGKTVTYLQHGVLDSSATWVIMGQQHSLGWFRKAHKSEYFHSLSLYIGYMLADLGYDVWLGNKRGNRYSRDHIINDPDGFRGDRGRFWDFSWHHVCLWKLTNFISVYLPVKI